MVKLSRQKLLSEFEVWTTIRSESVLRKWNHEASRSDNNSLAVIAERRRGKVGERAQTMAQESEEGVSEMTILKMEMEDSEMIYISF